MFDLGQMSLFYLDKRISKRKMAICSKNLVGP